MLFELLTSRQNIVDCSASLDVPITDGNLSLLKEVEKKVKLLEYFLPVCNFSIHNETRQTSVTRQYFPSVRIFLLVPTDKPKEI